MGKCREIDYVQVRDLAVAGASRTVIAQVCGLSDAGFYARMKKDGQLAEAVAAEGRSRHRNGKPAEAVAADGRSRHRNGKPAEPAAEPALEPVQLEADGETYDADADLARCVLLDDVQEAVGEGFNLTRAIAHQIGEPVWKVARALEELEAEGRVECVETATFTAYVLPGTVPAGSRPVLNGEGGVRFVIGDEDKTETPVCADDADTAAYIRTGDDEGPDADEEGDPIWWCLGCGHPVDLDSPASVVLRPQRRAWCSLRCFDGAARSGGGHSEEKAKGYLLEAVADPDCVSLAFASGGCLTLEFADVHLLALLPRERRLVRAIWKAVERFEEAGNGED